jgi:DNA polymerase III delta prime subunit
MHSYLIVGTNQDKIGVKIDEIVKKLNAITVMATVAKIDDVRLLNKSLSLHVNENSVYILDNFKNASVEAQNALLKTIEEPQENVYFILCVSRENNILPTIVSRCQIINAGNENVSQSDIEQAEKFIKADKSNQLLFLSKLTKKESAQMFLETLIKGSLNSLVNKPDYTKILEEATSCLAKIKANGNVTLHLTNFVSSLD